MPRPPRLPHGVESPTGLATLVSLLLATVLAACSGDLLADGSSTESPALDASPFGPALAGNLDGLVAHSQRITPTPEWDGSIDGLKTLWYESGVKRGEGRFVKGSREDAWTYWYENGQKRWEGTYHADQVHGVERSWYANGTLCYEGTSVGGRRHGAFRAWYEDGRPWWQGEYVLGVREGPFQYWRRDGTPDAKVSGSYVDGKRVKPLVANELAVAAPK